MVAARTSSGIIGVTRQPSGFPPLGGKRTCRKRHIVASLILVVGLYSLVALVAKAPVTVTINVHNGDKQELQPTPSVVPVPSAAPVPSAVPAPTPYSMFDYLDKAKIREPPLCDPNNPQQGLALQNLHRQQCIIYNETEVYMHRCADNRVVRFCVHPETKRLQTVDGKCVGVSDSNKASDPEARMSFYNCMDDYKPFAWVPGGLLNMQLLNGNFEMEGGPMCLDVLHQRRDAPVIQWKCKGEKNYKPTNQLWYWV